jgi:hypothetical protein
MVITSCNRFESKLSPVETIELSREILPEVKIRYDGIHRCFWQVPRLNQIDASSKQSFWPMRHQITQYKNLLTVEFPSFEECEEIFLKSIDFSSSLKNSHSECNHLDCSKHTSGFIKQLCLTLSFSPSDFHHCILQDNPFKAVDSNYCNVIERWAKNWMTITVFREEIREVNQLLLRAWNIGTFVIDANLEPNQPTIKNFLKDGSRNEFKFDSGPNNQLNRRSIGGSISSRPTPLYRDNSTQINTNTNYITASVYSIPPIIIITLVEK